MSRDGQLSKKEVNKILKDLNALSELGLKTKNAERASVEMIDQLDDNVDGKISLVEFLNLGLK